MNETSKSSIGLEQPVAKEVWRNALSVSRRVSINGISLKRHEARVTNLTDEFPSLMSETRSHSVRRDTDSDSILIDASFRFAMAYDTDESKEKPPVMVSATFGLLYAIEDVGSVSEEELNAFGEVNGIFNAWPYWRELLQSTLSRMGLPSITLPIYRILPEEQS